MINGRKAIGFITCGVTGDSQKDLCQNMLKYARQFGYDFIVFNIVGTIGADYQGYGKYENNLVDIIPYDKLEGIVFNNSNVITEDIRELFYEKLRTVKCPVITVGLPRDEFYTIRFNNSYGIREMVDHFVEHHGFTRIGYMSGIKGHVDAVERLETFRDAMRSHGLPEDGVGIFHGDFWYNTSWDAANFFWKECRERPQAIICANDYMALSLADYLEDIGAKVPDMVCVSGFDGDVEGKMHCPSITTVDRDNDYMAKACYEIIENVNQGKEQQRCTVVPTTNRYLASCGCLSAEEDDRRVKKNAAFLKSLSFIYYIYDTEAAMLEMNRVDTANEIGETFARYGVNIGNYDKFFVFAYMDKNGYRSYEKEINAPTEKVSPAVWIDKTGTTRHPGNSMDLSELLPEDTTEGTKCYYVSHIHFGNHCFGYSVIQMSNDETFNEFYKIWTVNIAISFESLLNKNNIRSLVEDLEHESTHDRLTGLLNRRGFEQLSEEMFDSLDDPEKCVGAIMIDMDKLKRINDDFGHGEGDYAIQALGQMIGYCCTNGEIAGRTGGDEFYVFATDYDQEKADTFVRNLRKALDLFNESENKEYVLDASWGIYIKKVSEIGSMENLLKLSDELMYSEKRKKYKYQK